MKKPRLVKVDGDWMCFVSSDDGLSGLMTRAKSWQVAYDMMRLRLWNEYNIIIPVRL